MAAQLQLPPLGNYNVRPTGGDDWLAPHWNRGYAVWLICDNAIFKGCDEFSLGKKIQPRTAPLLMNVYLMTSKKEMEIHEKCKKQSGVTATKDDFNYRLLS